MQKRTNVLSNRIPALFRKALFNPDRTLKVNNKNFTRRHLRSGKHTCESRRDLFLVLHFPSK
jgi:hypothetical protein